MAFDSGMLKAVIGEINSVAAGLKVDKVYQPQNDEIDLLLRGRNGTERLLLRCGSQDTRIQLTSLERDSPQSPPNFCVLLRKHLQGSVLSGICQEGFERVARLKFQCRDEMGYDCEKYLFAEVMGRNSNLIFTDGNLRIIAAMRLVDFSTSRLRQVLPGMAYELPPAQEGKLNPVSSSLTDFENAVEAGFGKPAAKQICSSFFGICPAVAREAVFRAFGDTEAVCGSFDVSRLFETLENVLKASETAGVPCMAYMDGHPADFSFVELTQYGPGAFRTFESYAEMLDAYYGERDRSAMTSARAGDLSKTVNSAMARLRRKLDIQRSELADCDREDEYRSDGELILANLYRLKKGDSSVRVIDYSAQNSDGTFAERTLKLDSRLSPSENAQRLFKKYSKCRKARTELTRQISIAEEELAYLSGVSSSISRAETGADIAGIRDELEKAGYVRQKKGAAPAKSVRNSPALYVTTGGFSVLCGKNNFQNEEITFKLALKGDIWFHAKGVPGSHVLLKADGREVPASDMTEAAEIAAANSDAAGGINIPVDYTDVRNIKKPSGSRPGYVIYHTNRTAFVTPVQERLDAMKRKRQKQQ